MKKKKKFKIIGSMEKLELKHLSPYLPYGLKFSIQSELYPKISMTGLNGIFIYGNYHGTHLSFEIEKVKPILRPLSDLTREIQHNVEKFVPIEWLEDKYYTLDLHKQCLKLLEEDGENWINQTDYMLVEHIQEWHFDVFGLIPKGLAIDINTLE